jgi:hypothetical protein
MVVLDELPFEHLATTFLLKHLRILHVKKIIKNLPFKEEGVSSKLCGPAWNIADILSTVKYRFLH